MNETNNWINYATSCDRQAQYEESLGNHGSAAVYRSKAAMGRNAAEAMELEAKTGKPHCACHLKPLEDFKDPSPPRKALR